MTPAALQRGLGLAAVSVLIGCMLTGGLAARPSAARTGGPAGADDPTAITALTRAVEAEHAVGYRGTRFVTTWRGRDKIGSATLDVTNLPGKGTVVSRPGGGTARYVPRGTDIRPLQALTEVHGVRLAGAARTVGRPSTVVEAVRTDGSLAARFFLDREYDLVLRRELYDDGGGAALVSAFTDVVFDQDVVVARLPQASAPRAGVQVPATGYEALTAGGWDCCPRTISGTYGLQDVRRAGGTVQLIYSDGLVNASIFEQRGNLRAGSLDGFVRHDDAQGTIHVRYGLTSYAVWSHRETVYTAACDTPHCVDKIVASYPHDPADRPSGAADAGIDGVGQRIDRGMGRLLAWLNPLD